MLIKWKIKSAWVWLMRIGHCRGFGIQSPWAYRFVCHVINEHREYPMYEELARQMPGLHPLTVKLGRLYLRIANHVSPKTVISIGADGETYGRYIHAGCRGASVISLPPDGQTADKLGVIDQAAGIDMLRFAPSADSHAVWKAALTKAHDGSVFILEGIKYDAEMRRLWAEVVESTADMVTFDLYYCGVACFKTKLYKQNYVVNF